MLMQSKLNNLFIMGSLAAAIAMPSLTQAAFIEDAEGSLSLRNFYMNRDFRDNSSGQSKAEDWGQGFILRLQSGYTEGTVGVGVDALGLAGVKLDSGGGTGGTGALVHKSSGKSANSHGFVGITGKA